MSCHPAISSLVTYGIEGEEKLITAISVCVGEPVTKTVHTFDSMDMVGKTVFAELKRRSSDYFYTDSKIQKEGWLMPSCKVMKGWEEISKGKRVYFFYFWMRDKSLWVYEMKEGDFSNSDDYVTPKNHYDNMLHVRVLQNRWKRVDIDLSGIVFEEDLCWITD